MQGEGHLVDLGPQELIGSMAERPSRGLAGRRLVVACAAPGQGCGTGGVVTMGPDPAKVGVRLEGLVPEPGRGGEVPGVVGELGAGQLLGEVGRLRRTLEDRRQPRIEGGSGGRRGWRGTTGEDVSVQGRRVPDPRGAIAGCREDTGAVGAELRGVDLGEVSLQREDLDPGGRVSKLHLPVDAGGDDATSAMAASGRT